MTLADDLKAENELLRRRFVHATRKRGPLTMSEARDLCRRMAGEDGTEPPPPAQNPRSEPPDT
jgi:hypothetical protein